MSDTPGIKHHCDRHAEVNQAIISLVVQTIMYQESKYLKLCQFEFLLVIFVNIPYTQAFLSPEKKILKTLRVFHIEKWYMSDTPGIKHHCDRHAEVNQARISLVVQTIMYQESKYLKLCQFEFLLVIFVNIPYTQAFLSPEKKY